MSTALRRLFAWLGRGAGWLVGWEPPSPPSAALVGFVLLTGTGAVLALGPSGLAIVGAVVVGLVTRQRAESQRRADELMETLAEVLPLLQQANAAGLTVRGALGAVSPWVHGPFGEALREAAGIDNERAPLLADLLDEIPPRLGETCRPLCTLLASADRYGTPLAGPLDRLAAELAVHRRRRFELAARRVPVKLLFPLAVGVLPAFVLLTVVPLLVTSLKGVSLHP